MLWSQYLANFGDGIGRTKESKYNSAYVVVQATCPLTGSFNNGQTPNNDNPHFTWHEVQPDVGRMNAQLEGVLWADLADDFKRTTVVTVRQEYIQEMVRGGELTNTQKKASITTVVTGKTEDEVYWNMNLGLKTDHERVASSNQAGAAGTGVSGTGAVSTARKMNAYFQQIDTSTTVDLSEIEGADTKFDLGKAFPDSDMDPNCGTLYHVDTVSRKIWEAGGYEFDGGNNPEAKNVMGGNSNMIVGNANHIQGITYSLDRRDNSWRTQNPSRRMAFSLSWRTYTAPFGQDFQFAPSPFILGANADDTTAGIAIFNGQNWTNVYYEDVDAYPLGIEGSRQRYWSELKVGLMHRHRKASGAIVGLTKEGYKTSD